MSRRRRIIGLALVVGTVIAALSTLNAAEYDVSLRYEAPPGPLTVTLITEEGTRVRRTSFAVGSERQHEIRLPNGHFRARLELPDLPAQEERFHVEEDRAVLIRWWR